VGPTGAGKTTTIGKLAARYVLKHGADSVALLTTDTYRIGAQDQLRSLGRILNVAVEVVNEYQDLPKVLSNLQHYSLVLIDTAGFRHGDPLFNEQLQALEREAMIDSYLVLPCNSQRQMLSASIDAHQMAGLRGCILSKLDETSSLGDAIAVLAEQSLPLAYTTNGQQIPEDIDVARAHQLVAKAVSLMNHPPLESVRFTSKLGQKAANMRGNAAAGASRHL